MMNRINAIWKELESKTASKRGLVKIRFSDKSFCDIYLGLKYPEEFRMLVFRTPLKTGVNFNFVYDFKGLKFEKIYDSENNSYLLLNLVLVDIRFIDVFDSLINDVINNIIEEDNIEIALKIYSNRLTLWQSLFEKYNDQGLTPEQQRGLFGELFFLRKYLQYKSDFQKVLNTWVGTSKEVRDFQFNDWALEVKTTSGNNHQKIHISSERQLDISHLDTLFLYHLSLERAQESGESLPQIILSIQSLLKSDTISINRFQAKLYEVGYFDQHVNLYEEIGYHVRQDNYYKIEGDFPRVQENEMRKGVGDVKYTIIVSQCQHYLNSEIQVLEKISRL